MMEKGTFVRVSDGTIEPPKHHKKKHSLWKMKNFDEYVWRDETEVYGTIAVGESRNSVLVVSLPSRWVVPVQTNGGC